MKRFILFGLLAMFFSCGTTDVEPISGTVEYEVTCIPNGFNVTYSNNQGGTNQYDANGGSWSTSFIMNKDDFVSLMAQADNYDATVTVRIKYQEKVFKESTSSGNFVIASVSGILP